MAKVIKFIKDASELLKRPVGQNSACANCEHSAWFLDNTRVFGPYKGCGAPICICPKLGYMMTYGLTKDDGSNAFCHPLVGSLCSMHKEATDLVELDPKKLNGK